MGQVTIYLDAKTEKKMLESVQASGLSKSKWIAQLIEKNTRTDWPLEVREMSGSWNDFPTVEEFRDNQSADLPREDW